MFRINLIFVASILVGCATYEEPVIVVANNERAGDKVAVLPAEPDVTETISLNIEAFIDIESTAKKMLQEGKLKKVSASADSLTLQVTGPKTTISNLKKEWGAYLEDIFPQEEGFPKPFSCPHGKQADLLAAVSEQLKEGNLNHVDYEWFEKTGGTVVANLFGKKRGVVRVRNAMYNTIPVLIPTQSPRIKEIYEVIADLGSDISSTEIIWSGNYLFIRGSKTGTEKIKALLN